MIQVSLLKDMNKKILKNISLLMGIKTQVILTAMTCFLSSFELAAKEKIRLSTGEWAPYTSESLEQRGIFSQITVEAFATQGIDVELGFFPWPRVFQLSKKGEWDGTIAFAKTSEREKYYIYSEPLYTGQYALFHLKSRPLKWKKYTDLKHIKIAATRGFGGMGQEFLDAENNKVINVDRLASDEQSFNMLVLDRVQAVASDIEVGYALVHKIFGPNKALTITHSSHLIQLAKYHLVMPKNLPESALRIKKFNAGLSILKQSGRYAQIIEEYYRNKLYKDSIPSSVVAKSLR